MNYIASIAVWPFKRPLHMIEYILGFHSFGVCKTLAAVGILVNLGLFYLNLAAPNETLAEEVIFLRAGIYGLSAVAFGLLIALSKQNEERWFQRMRVFSCQGAIEDNYKVAVAFIVGLSLSLFLFKEDAGSREIMKMIFCESLAVWVLVCVCSIKPYFSPCRGGQDERKATAKEGKAWILSSFLLMIALHFSPWSTVDVCATITYITVFLFIVSDQRYRRSKANSPPES